VAVGTSTRSVHLLSLSSCCFPREGELASSVGQAGVQGDGLVGEVEDKVRETGATIIVE